MRGLFDKPKVVYGILVPLLVGLWFLSGVGGERTPSDPGALYRIGAIAWFFFGLTLVITVVYTVTLLIRQLTGTGRGATS